MRLKGSITHRIEHETAGGRVVSFWAVPYSARFVNHQLDEIEADGRPTLVELVEVRDNKPVPKQLPVEDLSAWEIEFNRETKHEDFTERFSNNANEEYWARRRGQ